MKALFLTLSLISLLAVMDAKAKEVKESREIAGEMLKKKKKKDSMWARDLRGKLSVQSSVGIRTW